jgi:hypothetical protein
LDPAAIVIVFAGSAAPFSSTAQPTAEGASIVGAWTLNKDASDPPPGRSEGERGRRSGDGGGGFGRGGGYGRGGGGGRGAGGGGFGNRDPEGPAPDPGDARPARDARTTRLSADGKKIKDESTGMERKTTWENGNLVSG